MTAQRLMPMLKYCAKKSECKEKKTLRNICRVSRRYNLVNLVTDHSSATSGEAHVPEQLVSRLLCL